MHVYTYICVKSVNLILHLYPELGPKSSELVIGLPNQVRTPAARLDIWREHNLQRKLNTCVHT